MTNQIISGYKKYVVLNEFVDEFSAQKIFFVTGKRSYALCGAKKYIGEIVKKIPHVHFFEFENNPKVEDINKGIRLFKKEKCDLIVAVGGGSVIDTAKSISLFVSQNFAIEEYFDKKYELIPREIPLIVIPTTAGTGSESTSFSVIYLGKEKKSLAHHSLLPDRVILDPVFFEHIPPYTAACSAIDALSQAIEAYWSVNSTEESREYSKQAIKLIRKNIESFIQHPNRKNIAQMLSGSNYAGKAINIAKTTAVHAVSYPITSYFGLPHGHAVALTLAEFVKFNSNVTEDNVQDKRGPEFVKNIMEKLKNMFGAEDYSQLAEIIESLVLKVGLKLKLRENGISKNDIEIIVKNGFNPQRVKNNPIRLAEKDLRIILERIL